MIRAMQRKIGIALAMLTLVAGAATGPARAEQSAASEFFFGKAYDDNVIAIQVAPIYGQGDGFERTLQSGNALTERLAQSKASRDPGLRQSLAIRGIALHNVLRVDTAANGGKVVYYR